MNFYLRAKRRLRNRTAKFLIYTYVAKLRGHIGLRELCRAKLIIDAPPRSGNSFAEAIFRLAFPTTPLIHHTHASGVVKWGLAHNIPCVILVRHPDAVAVSAILEQPAVYDFKMAYEEWNLFYESYDKIRAHIQFVKFETLTSNPIEFARQVAKMIRVEPTEFVLNGYLSSYAMILVDELARERVGINHTNYSLVSTERQKRDAEKAMLLNQAKSLMLPERLQSIQLYERVMQYVK
jgi:hypothetical protein